MTRIGIIPPALRTRFGIKIGPDDIETRKLYAGQTSEEMAQFLLLNGGDVYVAEDFSQVGTHLGEVGKNKGGVVIVPSDVYQKNEKGIHERTGLLQDGGLDVSRTTLGGGKGECYVFTN